MAGKEEERKRLKGVGGRGEERRLSWREGGGGGEGGEGRMYGAGGKGVTKRGGG